MHQWRVHRSLQPIQQRPHVPVVLPRVWYIADGWRLDHSERFLVRNDGFPGNGIGSYYFPAYIRMCSCTTGFFCFSNSSLLYRQESEKRFLALGKQPTVDVQEPSTNTYFDERNRTESRFAKFMRASQENNFSASATPSTNQSYLTTFSSALSSALKSVTRVSPTPTMISPTTESTFTTTDTVASTDAFVFTDNFAVSSTDTYTLSSTDPYVFTESNSNSSDDTYGFSDTPDSFYSLASHL